jgi:hypothetical protein
LFFKCHAEENRGFTLYAANAVAEALQLELTGAITGGVIGEVTGGIVDPLLLFPPPHATKNNNVTPTADLERKYNQSFLNII